MWQSAGLRSFTENTREEYGTAVLRYRQHEKRCMKKIEFF